MKHITIRNLGPLSEVDIDLKKINVFIGPQSSGKSSVLKTICYCTWVEKRIELAQSPEFFQKKNVFVDEWVRFHKLKGYVRKDTFVEYESDFMHFSYDHSTKEFQFAWKAGRWDYLRSKVTYIPAERNMVAAVPNWFEVKLADDNIRDFMSDWEVARKAVRRQLPVLNLGVSYYYEAVSHSDRVALDDGTKLDFTNTSSGLQSLVPLFVHLHYLDKLQYRLDKNESVKSEHENQKLLSLMHRELFEDELIATLREKGTPDPVTGKMFAPSDWVLKTFGPVAYPFASQDAADKCEEIYSRYSSNHFCDIFLEEPEENLFPPTQARLMDWLVGITKGPHGSNLSMATHSPYIVTALLEEPGLDFGLFFTCVKEGKSYVKAATGQDIQDIYDNGVDVFFNLETFA